MNHKNLDVWQKSMDFVVEIYCITQEFPKEEKFGLVDQLRRACVSIPSNIAEGSGRSGEKEFIRFLHISLGSLVEVDTQLIIAKRLKYIDIDESDRLLNDLNNIKRMLIGLINQQKRRINEK